MVGDEAASRPNPWIAKMLQNILLVILFLNLVASPACAGVLIQGSNQPASRTHTFFMNHRDGSNPGFKANVSKFSVVSKHKRRFQGFIAPPFYRLDGWSNYENPEIETVTFIVDGHKKKEEAAEPSAKKQKPVPAPHIVTLEGNKSSNAVKFAGRRNDVVEIRGTQVSQANIPPE